MIRRSFFVPFVIGLTLGAPVAVLAQEWTVAREAVPVAGAAFEPTLEWLWKRAVSDVPEPPIAPRRGGRAPAPAASSPR